MSFWKDLQRNVRAVVKGSMADSGGLTMLAMKTVMDVETSMSGKSGADKFKVAADSLRSTIATMGIQMAPDMLDATINTLINAAHLNVKCAAPLPEKLSPTSPATKKK